MKPFLFLLILAAITFAFAGDTLLDSTSWCRVSIHRTTPTIGADCVTITVYTFADKNDVFKLDISPKFSVRGLDVVKTTGTTKTIPEQKIIEWKEIQK